MNKRCVVALGLMCGWLSSSLDADQCYEFLGMNDECIQLHQEDCGGACEQVNGEWACSNPFENWHIEPGGVITWDAVQAAESGYQAVSGGEIHCGLIAECLCVDMDGDGTPETCDTNWDDLQPYVDDFIGLDINTPCPEIYDGQGYYDDYYDEGGRGSDDHGG